MKRLLNFLVIFILATPCGASADTYEIDVVHSSVGFKVKHLMVSYTHGKFEKFEGWFTYDPKQPKASKAHAVINAASITTENEKRDGHLRSADFFDVETYPTLEFTSTGFEVSKSGKAALRGNLTMHGVTKPVKLDVEVGGMINDPWGNTRAGFTAAGKINRKDFGIAWNKALDAGGLMVGEDVHLMIEVEGIHKK